jgi:hypothetical protein
MSAARLANKLCGHGGDTSKLVVGGHRVNEPICDHSSLYRHNFKRQLNHRVFYLLQEFKVSAWPRVTKPLEESPHGLHVPIANLSSQPLPRFKSPSLRSNRLLKKTIIATKARRH